MNLFFIEKYIQKIKKDDIYNYALNQGLNLTPNELDTIYYYIKNYYKPFLNGKDKELIQEIKKKVSPKTATKIEELYMLYKNRL